MLLFMDGMAHYATAGIDHKYTVRDSSFCTWSIVPEGRFGNCLKRVSTNNFNQSGFLGIAPLTSRTGLWTPQPSGVCGFAIKVDDLARISSSSETLGQASGFLVVEETGLTSGIGAEPYHIRVLLNENGTFTLQRRATGIGGDFVLATSLEGLTSNTWMYVEMKWLIDDTVGTFELRVNTIPVLTYIGDTRVSDSASFGVWNSVRLFSVAAKPGPSWLTMRISDFYLADLTGGAGDVKDFLGDGIVATIYPDGPGLASSWTPVDAVPNWDQVNDKPVPDGDATYVSATAAGTRDCHTFENIPTGSTVLGVHYNALVRKEDEGSVTVKPITGQAGVQYDGPTQGVASTLYDRYVTQSYDINPATGAQWTAAEINAGQWGLLKAT